MRTYQMLDVGLEIQAAPGVFLDTFHQDYARFEVPRLPPGKRLSVRFEPGSSGSGSFFEVDGVRENLDGNLFPERFAAQSLMQILLQRVEAFTILHAAVLGRPGGALAISGPSGAGKTTLTLALLNRGWSYYSDDFCPLHRETGLVHPFPRSLWVRPPAPAEPRAGHPRQGKVPLPLAEGRCTISGPPLPLKSLICLGAKPQEGAASLTSLWVNLRPGLGGPLLEELRSLEGTVLIVDPENDLRWTLRYPRGGGRTRQIKGILHRHREALWNVFSQPRARPDFSQEPVLALIPPHEAAYFLLQELKHDLGEVRRPSAMKPGALLSHLLTMLAGVACYRLTPGPLDRCLALVDQALETVES